MANNSLFYYLSGYYYYYEDYSYGKILLLETKLSRPVILGKAGVESVFLHLVSFAHALQSPLFLQTAVFYFLNEKIDNKCQKRATVSGQIKQNGE